MARRPRPPVDRNLALELVRTTEYAALAAARWIGHGVEPFQDRGDLAVGLERRELEDGHDALANLVDPVVADDFT